MRELKCWNCKKKDVCPEYIDRFSDKGIYELERKEEKCEIPPKETKWKPCCYQISSQN